MFLCQTKVWHILLLLGVKEHCIGLKLWDVGVFELNNNSVASFSYKETANGEFGEALESESWHIVFHLSSFTTNVT